MCVESSVGNAVLGVPKKASPWGEAPPKGGDEVKIFISLCSGRCPHRPKSYMSLFACGELVRRGRRTLRIFREFVRFQAGEHSSPLRCCRWFLLFSRNAEDSVPYRGFADGFRRFQAESSLNNAFAADLCLTDIFYDIWAIKSIKIFDKSAFWTKYLTIPGALSADEYKAFLKELENADKKGMYIFSKPYYIYKGIKKR